MLLNHNIHLGYCTNIHRGETWEETFSALRNYTLAVKARISPDRPYGIGLRLGHLAADDLADPATLNRFKEWLDANDCYVFTINGFPYGTFHGTRVKEAVYRPDWTCDERVHYTLRLFDILAELAPEESGGSISSVPGSFKEFITSASQVQTMRDNVSRVGEYILKLSERTGKDLHLGLEPEPLCWFETTDETIEFLDPIDPGLKSVVGVNYDTCHLAVEFEEAAESLQRLHDAGIRLSKLHLSSALRLQPTVEALDRLKPFAEGVYFHQVVEKDNATGNLVRYRDLDEALAAAARDPSDIGDEWRIHFHVPVYANPHFVFGDTRHHVTAALDFVAANPGVCRHMEIETYTWEVLPDELRSQNVVDQLVKEYHWCLGKMRERDLA